MTSTTRIDDEDLQRAVQQELEWTPDVDSAGIGVAVEDGTVALSGEVDSHPERLAARHAALRVRGVNAVIDHLGLPSSPDEHMADTAVAEEVEHALRAAADVPPGVKAVIEGGDVSLMGEVDWDYERRAAKRAVQHLKGVRTVNSMITLTARPSAADAEERIRGAIRRNALVDAHTIEVAVSGTTVMLTGTVRSWAEKNQAVEAAWASPHVTEVDNRIVVRPY